MRHTMRNLVVGAAMLLGVAACANLDVVNTNQADRTRALSTPGDVESLISGAFNTWFNGNYYYYGPGLFMSNQSFQHAAPWANAGMFDYGKLPRVGIVNDASDVDYTYWTYPWYHMYRAIAAASNGLSSLSNKSVADALNAASPGSVARDQAFAYFILGMAHASLAILYDQGFVVDETTDVSKTQTAVDYKAMMAAAMTYFGKSLALCQANTFTLPQTWVMSTVDNNMLAQIIHSEEARYAAANARTPTERQALDWTTIMSNIDAGVTSSWMMDMDGATNNWFQGVLWLANWGGWGEAPYWIYGMADTSGNYKTWLDQSLASKLPNAPDIVIVTPDLRFPRGTTIVQQQSNPGSVLMAMSNSDARGVWAHPERGQWRWSWYHNDQYGTPAGDPGTVNDYEDQYTGNLPEIPMTEMNLLKAEGLYYGGAANYAQVAAIINQTRVAAGLNATDATGTNTSCVPNVPAGDGTSTLQCGNLWEMLKWEKRMEGAFLGTYGVPWYFDSRGWGDLWKDTELEFPIPCQEMQTLQILPCYTFGGPGGNESAPTSTYAFPGEG